MGAIAKRFIFRMAAAAERYPVSYFVFIAVASFYRYSAFYPERSA